MAVSNLQRRIARLEAQHGTDLCPGCGRLPNGRYSPDQPVTVDIIAPPPVENIHDPRPSEPPRPLPPPCSACGRVPQVIEITLDLAPPEAPDWPVDEDEGAAPEPDARALAALEAGAWPEDDAGDDGA
jgi:hypothetical protein